MAPRQRTQHLFRHRLNGTSQKDHNFRPPWRILMNYKPILINFSCICCSKVCGELHSVFNQSVAIKKSIERAQCKGGSQTTSSAKKPLKKSSWRCLISQPASSFEIRHAFGRTNSHLARGLSHAFIYQKPRRSILQPTAGFLERKMLQIGFCYLVYEGATHFRPHSFALVQYFLPLLAFQLSHGIWQCGI